MAEGVRRTFRSAEALRLEEIRHGKHWRRWGPYLSERQWGTVREDYSEHGTAWEYFPHDHARSRAYRWGEDGIGGFGDDHLLLCLGLALWNGRDPILKERLFGLTNSQGNHGEDVKELYYYLDGTPTHSYMRMLYKYPQAAFPYAQLVEENRRRGRADPEFELIDTGVFADNRYFDVEIEYAKADVDDILIQLTIHNRAAEAAMLHVLPQLWARNTWSWKPELDAAPARCARGQFDLDRSPASAAAAASLRRPSRISVLPKRDKYKASVRDRRTGPPLQRRHQRLCRERRHRGRQTGSSGYQSGGALSAQPAGRRKGPVACAIEPCRPPFRSRRF